MTVFSKDPRSPEVIEVLKRKGEVLIEVTVKQLFVLHAGDDRSLEELMEEWFVKYRGCSHAYRDGSHIGGADEVVSVMNLTGGKEIALRRWEKSARYPGYEECMVGGYLLTRPIGQNNGTQ